MKVNVFLDNVKTEVDLSCYPGGIDGVIIGEEFEIGGGIYTVNRVIRSEGELTIMMKTSYPEVVSLNMFTNSKYGFNITEVLSNDDIVELVNKTKSGEISLNTLIESYNDLLENKFGFQHTLSIGITKDIICHIKSRL